MKMSVPWLLNGWQGQYRSARETDQGQRTGKLPCPLPHRKASRLRRRMSGPCPGRSGSCGRTQMRLQGSFTIEGKSTLPWPSGPGPRVSCCALRLCGGWEWQPQPSWPVIKITHRYSTSYPCHIVFSYHFNFLFVHKLFSYHSHPFLYRVCAKTTW